MLDIFYDGDKEGGDFGYQIRLYSYDEMDWNNSEQWMVNKGNSEQYIF
jgi:hypothetical protein